MTEHRIINAADHFAKKPIPARVDPLWTRTPDETRAMFCPSVKTLPFVSTEWRNDYWPASMWVDVPTDDYQADRERGRVFAAMTIAAICADHPIIQPLQIIFHAIVDDAIRRRAKGGKGSRTLPGAVDGFLEGLGKFIESQCRQHSAPPSA
jgi:hypothetical protein